MQEQSNIIAVDFDGTISASGFPHIGPLVPGAKETIQALRDNGHKVFLWTMRGNDMYREHADLLAEVKEWLAEEGIELDGFNVSPEQFSSSPKQFAHWYIDDANIGCPVVINHFEGIGRRRVVDWRAVASHLCLYELITDVQYKSIKSNILNYEC